MELASGVIVYFSVEVEGKKITLLIANGTSVV